jgi:putative addiction module component (TIGR02574 family)
MTAAKDLRQELLDLPREERAGLARELLESLDGPPDADSEQAWLDEAERRSAAIDAGSVQLDDWNEVRDRISKKLRALRP